MNIILLHAESLEIYNYAVNAINRKLNDSHRGLTTPKQYRAKWGLPADCPMLRQNYAAQRSASAQKIAWAG